MAPQIDSSTSEESLEPPPSALRQSSTARVRLLGRRASQILTSRKHSDVAFRDPGGLGGSLRAPSVYYLCNEFPRMLEAVGLTGASKVHEIEELIFRPESKDAICPRDGQRGCAFVDTIPDGSAGRATHMLSYSWGYSMEVITNSLAAYCSRSGLDPRTTYVWICAVCINQHRVQEARASGREVDFEDFRSEFAERVTGIGHVLSLMEPWYAPKNLSRAWCIYELFMATDVPACKLDFIMPPCNDRNFAAAVINNSVNVAGMWEALASVCVCHAEASVKADKDNIMQLVERGPGLCALNDRVRSKLLAWFADAAEERVRHIIETGTLSEAAHACAKGASLFNIMDKSDTAIEVCLACCNRLKSENALDSAEGAIILTNLGRALTLQGSYTMVQTTFESALAMYRKSGTLHTSFGATLLEFDSVRLIMQGDPQGALPLLEKALAIRESTSTLVTEHGVSLITSMAVAKLRLGMDDEAIDHVEEAQEIGKACQGLEKSPLLGHSDLIRAVALARQGDLEGARGACEQARQRLNAVGFTRCNRTTRVLAVEAYIKVQSGDEEGALAHCLEARRTYNAAYIQHCPSFVDLLETEAYVRFRCGDREGAVACSQEAKRLMELGGYSSSLLLSFKDHLQLLDSTRGKISASLRHPRRYIRSLLTNKQVKSRRAAMNDRLAASFGS
eukprot:CAMPEP_0115395512 /NCGR_PEP_ID=MMETSP0271-20121206/12825_1 /TAXON_ID=71861 /ORGANISM="Scrippsiella trochoidea, Strain CCMP3099" /LENGTH=677 /DNA_ID=CAMNT_0002819227 /DNA_START=50 /DNA_END=2083 /DNA_ORIENTATION=+